MFEIDLQFFFSNLFLSYKLDICLLECEKDEKPQVHFRAPLIQKFKKCNISFTYNLQTWIYLNIFWTCDLYLKF